MVTEDAGEGTSQSQQDQGSWHEAEHAEESGDRLAIGDAGTWHETDEPSEGDSLATGDAGDVEPWHETEDPSGDAEESAGTVQLCACTLLH